jgi:hypothetical protein
MTYDLEPNRRIMQKKAASFVWVVQDTKFIMELAFFKKAAFVQYSKLEQAAVM